MSAKSVSSKTVGQAKRGPAGHRVLVRPDRVEETTRGGIVLPEVTKERDQRATQQGTVLEIGPSAWKEHWEGKPWAKVGDRVIFTRYAGVDLSYEARQLIDPSADRLTVINDEDVVYVLEEREE